MSSWETITLDEWVKAGNIELGRGDVISKDDIKKYHGAYPIYSSSAHNNAKFGEYAKFMFDEELITWSVDGGGSFFYRPKHRFSVTNVCGFMRVKSEKIHAPFTYYCFTNQHKKLTFDYTTKAHPSVIRKLYWLPKIDVNIQKKISSILQSIDEAIEKTEVLIEKYQQIKAGLMHDLFTRGIGVDGKLRPPREQAPELYQQTPIGWVPKDWIFTTCENVCEKIIDCKNRTPPITHDGFPVIRTPNVRNGMFIDNELVFTDFNSYNIWTARGKPVVGDVVITREAPVGEVCKIPERHHNACLGQRMMLYRTNPNKVVNDYFLYALQSEALQNRLDLISGGSTVGHVRVGDIRELWFFCPESTDEQANIAQSLNLISLKLETETNQLNKLIKQKSGLMHDLLTGNVQVPISSAEAAHV